MPRNNVFLSVQGHSISGHSPHELLSHAVCRVASWHDSPPASPARPAQHQEPNSLPYSGSFMRLFVDNTSCMLSLSIALLPMCNGLAKNHSSCCSQLSLLLFESFYCFPIFSILALSLLSLLAKSHLIQILSLVHLCYYLLYPLHVMYSSHLNFIIITT